MSHILADLLLDAAAVLARAGVDSPRLDARLLASAAFKCSPSDVLMHTSRHVADNERDLFQSYLDRRCGREPVSRILGVREFWGLPFLLSSDTLDPRPDSETIVETALKFIAARSESRLAILDVGTGSGCLLLAVLSECPSAYGIGLDRSEDAVRTAKANAAALSLGGRAGFITGDWLDSLHGSFDVIVSNPPYIQDSDIPGLDPEVRQFDPVLALSGGVDGLAAYRQILPACKRLLSPRGVMIFEIGQGQESDVQSLMAAEGLQRIESHRDLSGNIRCISAFGT